MIAPCVTCKRQLGKGLLPPPSPPLPEYRVHANRGFQTTGVDYAGPAMVKPIYKSSVVQVLNPAYICLITCATTRAVHLELVPNLEAESFIRALIRFFKRRGKPGLMIDDNATTFKSKRVISFLLQNGVKVIGTAKLTYEEMNTALIEIEGIINTRPLTYLHDNDISEPLTPSHLLIGHDLNVSNEAEPSSVISNAESMSNRYNYLQSTLEAAWDKFHRHYLTELREHHMYNHRKTKDDNVLQIGDVVVIKDEDVRSRNRWRLGRVESFVVGKDGKVRGANLKTISKKFRRTKMSRPLQKIIPLEI